MINLGMLSGNVLENVRKMFSFKFSPPGQNFIRISLSISLIMKKKFSEGGFGGWVWNLAFRF